MFFLPRNCQPGQLSDLIWYLNWCSSILFFEESRQKKHFYKYTSKGSTSFATGRIEIQSKITFEKYDFYFASIQFPEGDFHCAIKRYDENENIVELSKKLTDIYLNKPTTEIIRILDSTFGTEYYTLKDILIESKKDAVGVKSERKNIFVAIKDVDGSTKSLEEDEIQLATFESVDGGIELTIFIWLGSLAGEELIGSKISFSLLFDKI